MVQKAMSELQMKASIIDQMESPVVMFDENDSLMMLNQAAKDAWIVRNAVSLQEFIKDTNLKYVLTPERRRLGKTKEFQMAIHFGGKVYLIHGNEYWQNEQYMGLSLVYNDITEQENMKDEATYYATHDRLTGLWNRDYFFEMVEKLMRENQDETFLMIASDIGQFKLFNEILGIKAGDELLLTITNAYRKLRNNNWLFSRITADRFALVVPKKDFVEEDFLVCCHNVWHQSNYAFNIHNYIGVYEITNSRMSAEQMYNRAYLALETIKGDMQKEVAYYNECIRAQRLEERLTIDELERAVQSDEFVIYIQPQVNSRNDKVIGGETLVRWLSPKRGMVPPAEFVPLFEKNGMITKLDYHVWELACRQLAKWKEQGRQDWSLSVNISAKNFYLNDLYERITGLVEKYDVDPRLLKLEITETAFVLDVKKQMRLVKRLQDRGFLVEMDDFGSGYSSLNSLKDISLDVLKLDIKFFEKTDTPERSEKIISAMVGLARSLEMPVIAEGVENEEQLELLHRVKCDIVQGYFYSKPLPIEEYEAYVDMHGIDSLRHFIDEIKEQNK